jgi:site-specific recombinase XerD
MTHQKLFIDWLKNKGLKERTIESYVYYFNKFNTQFVVFNQENINKFLSLKNSRNNVAKAFLLSYQEFLMINWEELGLNKDIVDKITRVILPKKTGRLKKRIIRVLKLQQIRQLENALENERYKLMLLISFWCGFRLQELFSLRINSFNWETWKENQEKAGECNVLGKGDKEGVAFIPSFLMKRLRKFINEAGYMEHNQFLFKVPGYSPRNYQIKLREAGIKSGITQTNEKGEIINNTGVHPHLLRHSYASYLLNELGVDIMKIRDLLRHSSVNSTQVYAHLDKKKVKDLIDNLESY